MTEKGVYKGVLFIPFNDANLYNKDHSLIKVEPILNIQKVEDLFEGPKKVSGTQYLMYIAKENKDIFLNEEEDSEDEDDENESPFSPSSSKTRKSS